MPPVDVVFLYSSTFNLLKAWTVGITGKDINFLENINLLSLESAFAGDTINLYDLRKSGGMVLLKTIASSPSFTVFKAITYDNKDIWISENYNDGEISAISLVKYSFDGSRLKVITANQYEALCFDGRYLWGIYWLGTIDKIQCIDINSGIIFKSFNSSGAANTTRGITTDGKYLYIVYDDSLNPGSVIEVIDRNNNKIKSYFTGSSRMKGITYNGKNFVTNLN